MLPPPNDALLEWAIKKIESTLQDTGREPDWSDSNIEDLAEAARLYDDPMGGIQRRLRRRFLNTCGKLATSILLNNRTHGWITFGERVRRISPIFEITFIVERATEIIDDRLVPGLPIRFKVEDAGLVEEAREIAARFGDRISKPLLQRFCVGVSRLEEVIREHCHAPSCIDFARLMKMAIPSPQWIRDVETAIRVMEDLPDLEPSPYWFTERRFQIQHVYEVLKRFGAVGRPGPYYLPHWLLNSLNRAAFIFAEQILERQPTHLVTLRDRLRITKASWCKGYRYGGITVWQNRQVLSKEDSETPDCVPDDDAKFDDEIPDRLGDVTPVESATLIINNTLGQSGGPGWSRQDFDTLRTARELWQNLDRRIHGDLWCRFRSALTELVCCAIRRGEEAEWESFCGELLKVVPSEIDVALEVGVATRLIQKMMTGSSAQSWGEDELALLFRAADLTDRGAALMPELIAADFHLCWKAFERFIRRKRPNSVARGFAAALCEKIARQAPNSVFLTNVVAT